MIRMEFRLFEVHSLKAKRSILKRMMNQLQSKFNVSIAEVDKNDLWQNAVIGATIVGNEQGYVNSCLDQILKFVEHMDLGELVDHRIEMINF